MAAIVLLFFLLSPLIGIYSMEQGAFSLSLAAEGYSNGATIAYSFHLLFFSIGFLFSLRIKYSFLSNLGYSKELISWNKAGIYISTFNLFALLLTYFSFGGIYILLGEAGKGEFRTSLGIFGSIAFLFIKLFCPAFLAFMAHVFSSRGFNRTMKLIYLSNCFLVFLVGMGWGFKTTSIMMLLPSLIIIYWRINVFQLLIFIFFSSIMIVGLSMLFDGHEGGVVPVLEFLFTRLTVLQGDVSWFFWGEVSEGRISMDYFKTLTVIAGDRIFNLFTGISVNSYEVWVTYHYDLLITYLMGYPLEGIKKGHSITATIFSEGLFVFGPYFFVVFSFGSGLYSGFIYKGIRNALNNGNVFASSLFSTYFVFNLMSWINGGGVVTLFHISSMLGLILSYFFMVLICKKFIFSPRY